MKQQSRCGSGLGSHLEGQLGKNQLPSRYPLPQRVFVLTLFSARNTFLQLFGSLIHSHSLHLWLKITFSKRPFLTTLYKLTSVSYYITMLISFLALTCLYIYHLTFPFQSKSYQCRMSWSCKGAVNIEESAI